MNYFNQYDNGNWLGRLFAGLKEAGWSRRDVNTSSCSLPDVATPHLTLLSRLPTDTDCSILQSAWSCNDLSAPGGACAEMDAPAAARRRLVFQLNYRLCTLVPVVAQRGVHQSAAPPRLSAAHLDVLSLCGIQRPLDGALHHISTGTRRPISGAGAGRARLPICCILINMSPSGTIQQRSR